MGELMVVMLQVGGNYGPTILPQMQAQNLGCSQVTSAVMKAQFWWWWW